MASAASILGFFFYTVCVVLLLLLSAIRKIRLDKELLWVISFWLVINIIAFYYTKTSQNYNAILGPILLIIIPYLALKVIGDGFWIRLEKVIFILVVIDLILYALSNLYPSLFLSLYSIFRPWTNDALYEQSARDTNYWYSFIFTFNPKVIYRNSGFMWEPGAYGLILVLILLYRWGVNGMKIGKHEFVYIISIISTLSTASYFVLALLLMWYIFNMSNRFYKLLIIPISIYVFYWVYNMPFMGDKMDEFVYQTQINDYGLYENKLQANRILSFYIALEQVQYLPTGYGCTPSATFTPEYDSVSMVNGMGDLLTKWGYVGLLLIIYLIYLFWHIFYKSWFAFMATISYILVLFSNPISNNPILWLVVWSSLIYGKRHWKIKDKKYPKFYLRRVY